MPAALSSDHFFSGLTSSGRGGVIPSVNGPAESSRLAERCLWSSALESNDAAVGLLPPAFAAGFTFAWVTFGEQQARLIRVRMLRVLLRKDMAWFDGLEDGVDSLLVRIQTYVFSLSSLSTTSC